MNILLENCPTAVEINGIEYDINTDFRVGINIMLAFEDPELTLYEKQLIMLNLLYPKIPKNIKKAVEMAVKFLNCGEDSKSSAADREERLYSFEYDAKYIYSAIKQTHGIDLEQTDYLHWWKFVYMFMDLREDCFFSRILYYRRQKSKGKLTKEEAEYCNRIRDIIELPVHYTEQEKEIEAEFMRLLREGERKGGADKWLLGMTGA